MPLKGNRRGSSRATSRRAAGPRSRARRVCGTSASSRRASTRPTRSPATSAWSGRTVRSCARSTGRRSPTSSASSTCSRGLGASRGDPLGAGSVRDHGGRMAAVLPPRGRRDPPAAEPPHRGGGRRVLAAHDRRARVCVDQRTTSGTRPRRRTLPAHPSVVAPRECGALGLWRETRQGEKDGPAEVAGRVAARG